MESVAGVTLEKARFFVDQAGQADPNDREAIANYLEAAIVFARSITFHLQSQFAHISGFGEWYAEQQKRLADDHLSRFMLHQRNYVLKVGPASLKRIVGVTFTESIMLSDEVSVRVVRGKPWYRRSPRILLLDAIFPLRERIHRCARGGPKSRLRNCAVAQVALYKTRCSLPMPNGKTRPR